MKIFRVLVTTALLVLVPALAANAAVLSTPLLTANTPGGQTLGCSIVNVDTSPENVTILGISADGFVQLTVDFPNLPPNQGVTFPILILPTSQGFCEFIVPDNKSFRAAIVVGILSAGLITTIIAALPAF